MSPARDYYLPQRQLVAQNDSAIIESAHIPRSKFKNAWTRKTTFDAGYLIPILIDEILPGDSMHYRVTAYVRMATPLFPIFDNQRIDTFFFFVPNRILWTNWVRFMGEQPTGPADSIAFTVPRTADNGAQAVGSLQDHMGITTVGQLTQAYQVNALPFRAYNAIWNQWFRDQNIINAAPTNVGDGPDAVANYVLLRRAKSHDYFTSCLPWPQKFTEPTIPVAGFAPVLGIGLLTGQSSTIADPTFVNETGAAPNVPPTTSANYGASGFRPFDSALTWIGRSSETGSAANAYPQIFADLSQATGVAINTFRQAWMVQSLLERDARGGTRYVELVRTHFGVTNPDFRLQRPEYIGGGQSALQITPIAQTAPTTGVPLGALGGTGTAAGQHTANYAATEHGFIIGLINVRTELSYQQGLHKMWTRLTRFDYYWPAFAQLGEQAVLRGEIFHTGDPINDNIVFGFQERWHEYRTRYSEVVAEFKSTSAGNIDEWHLGQQFATAPTLSQTFIEDTPPMARILAAGAAAEGQQYLADILIQRDAVRPLPTYGTPAILGRF